MEKVVLPQDMSLGRGVPVTILGATLFVAA